MKGHNRANAWNVAKGICRALSKKVNNLSFLLKVLKENQKKVKSKEARDKDETEINKTENKEKNKHSQKSNI